MLYNIVLDHQGHIADYS